MKVNYSNFSIMELSNMIAGKETPYTSFGEFMPRFTTTSSCQKCFKPYEVLTHKEDIRRQDLNFP